MSRAKLFAENFFVYGLTGIIGKAIPLVMVPIVTRLIPDTSIYGAVDILRVIVSFGSAFAILGMYDAMFRLFFEKESISFKKQICSSAFFVILISSTITSLCIVFFSKTISLILFSDASYSFWVKIVGIQIFVSAVSNILKAPTRMQNKRKIFVFISFLSPLISYSISIPVIIFYDPFVGLISGSFGSVLFQLIFFYSLNRKWFDFKRFEKKKAKEMLKIGLPLLPTFLIYWVFSSFDRIMISNMLGTEQNGIYAVGAKMGQISNLIYTGFAGGWQYFAFSTMKDKDQVELNSKVFEYLGIISIAVTMFIIPFIPFAFRLLFTGDYVLGYQVAPYLFLSPLLLMLFQTTGNQLLIIKNTVSITLSLLLGAGLNVLLNFLLIPKLGIEGAAIATLTGYAISVLVITVITVKKKLTIIKNRFIFSVLIMILFFVLSKVVLNHFFIIWIGFSLLFLSIICWLYRDELCRLRKKMKK